MKNLSEHPLEKSSNLYVVFLIFIVVSGLIYFITDNSIIHTKKFEKNLSEAYDYQKTFDPDGQLILLNSVTDFEWDVVVRFQGQSNVKEVIDYVNIELEQFINSDLSNHGGFIFIKNNNIVFIYSKKIDPDYFNKVNIGLNYLNDDNIFVQSYDDAKIKVCEYGNKRLVIR